MPSASNTAMAAAGGMNSSGKLCSAKHYQQHTQTAWHLAHNCDCHGKAFTGVQQYGIQSTART